MEESIYYQQARLLLRILPILGRYPVFALKGGTAINFFIRNMPRLSVDIDLTYIPIDDRATALDVIDGALNSLKADIERFITKSVVMPKKVEGGVVALTIRTDGPVVKIEPNLVMRGTIFEPTTMSLTQHVQDMFGVSVSAKVIAFADIYGGKICAALDRQHPRDLFDIKLLLENEGITDLIRKSFVAHLISHNRPMAELLDPNFQNVEEAFRNAFEGMTFVKVSPEELEAARATLVKVIRASLTDEERHFILSVKKGYPDWDLLGLKGIDLLPAVKWKLLSIARMDKKKHKRALDKLEKCLDLL